MHKRLKTEHLVKGHHNGASDWELNLRPRYCMTDTKPLFHQATQSYLCQTLKGCKKQPRHLDQMAPKSIKVLKAMFSHNSLVTHCRMVPWKPNSLSVWWCGDAAVAVAVAAAAAAESDGTGHAAVVVVPMLPLLLVLPSSDNNDVASVLSRRPVAFVAALADGDSLPAVNCALVGCARDGVSIIYQLPPHGNFTHTHTPSLTAGVTLHVTASVSKNDETTKTPLSIHQTETATICLAKSKTQCLEVRKLAFYLTKLHVWKSDCKIQQHPEVRSVFHMDSVQKSLSLLTC